MYTAAACVQFQCVCVFVLVCVFVSVCVRVCFVCGVCIYTRMCVHVSVSKCVCCVYCVYYTGECVHMCVHVSVGVCVYVCVRVYISCYYGNPAMRISISLKSPGHLGDMNFDLVDIDNISQVKGHIMHSSNHNVHNEFHLKSIIDTTIRTQAVQAV